MRCWSVVVHWGPPCSDDPVSNSAVDRGPGRWPRGPEKAEGEETQPGYPPAVSVKVDIEQAGGRFPHKKEMSVSKLTLHHHQDSTRTTFQF